MGGDIETVEMLDYFFLSGKCRSGLASYVESP